MEDVLRVCTDLQDGDLRVSAVRKTTRSVVFGLFVLLLWNLPFPIIVQASIGFQPPTANELAMKSEPLAPGAPAIILYRQVDRDDNQRTPHEDNYVRIKVLSEEGRKYGDVELPFYKGYNNVVALKARTIRPD